MNPQPKAITVAILAMGGEGGGVLADWIVDMAERSGYYAQTTSVPGVAQRTGSTIYYLEMLDGAAVKAAGREPVLALMPVPGEVDVVIASELMEAGRAIQRGLVTPSRTTLIAATHRVYSMTEKTAMGDGRMDATALIAGSGAAARRFVHHDFARIASETGSVISAALFGALAATGALPFARNSFEDAIRRGGVGVPPSLAAFAAGWTAAAQPAGETVSARAGHARPLHVLVGARHASPANDIQPAVLSDGRIEREFPPASHEILLAGIGRLADYQDERYAAEYLDRLQTIRDVDREHGNGEYALLSATGRHLALWMSYEDAIRVADLKTRRARFARVRLEARAGDAELLRIHEFLHPRLAEIADILPAALGRRLLDSGWARRRVERFTGTGKVVQTTSIVGFLQLYVLAGLRPWRRKSLRYQRERQQIDRWLALLVTLAGEDFGLACEMAELPHLLKGYGDTHAQGSRNFEAIMNTLPELRRDKDGGGRLKKLREAALADDDGRKLAEVLTG
jgi:indolepyruvate ferredoxin oxidoreductase beta subunit